MKIQKTNRKKWMSGQMYEQARMKELTVINVRRSNQCLKSCLGVALYVTLLGDMHVHATVRTYITVYVYTQVAK